ncbi:MAG TPA: family 10 glycosylhydrolase [Tepidisphaeraceae bacterium]|nr:family 10 glycosylhydrolase [Tepidisphaeraceae bacterium]
MNKHRFSILRILILGLIAAAGCKPWSDPALEPPPGMREMRGVWVATVVNIDWPSKPGLSVDEQQREMLVILDRAKELKLNAIVLQVRTSCDAFYPSDLEPWSEYLTGQQGKPPEPFYDPLQMWIAEAHSRGLELHAWFNPFRARHPAAKTDAPNHISKSHPELVKQYGKYQWLDPGEPAAREHTLKVFRDVVHRYDIDGVHMDDYFYPYPEKGVDFPDDPSWQRYQKSGGKLSRADWRRQNINELIQKLYETIKDEKKHVKFGISPFGIWKPGNPPVVQGFNQYESLYADARLWLNKGWCDYYTPQLYWRISATSQPYKGLLDWWIGENKLGRNIYPGIAPYRVGNTQQNWPPQEIIEQIEATRARYPQASGTVHFSMKTLMTDRNGVAPLLREGPYKFDALMPASPWLDNDPPPQPQLTATPDGRGGAHLSWKSRGKGEDLWLWAVYIRRGGEWELNVLPGHINHLDVSQDTVTRKISAVALSAVDRNGNESRRRVVEIKQDEK